MNRRVIPVECGGCWAEAVGVRPAQDRPVAWIPSGRDWPLLSLGVASLGHRSLRLLGDPFSSVFLTEFLAFLTEFLMFLTEFLAFLTEFLTFLTEFLAFLDYLPFLPFSNGRYFRIGLPARG